MHRLELLVGNYSRGDRVHRASGCGRNWNFTTLLLVPLLPSMWKGKWFPKGIYDFHAAEVSIRFGREMPLQVGGDAYGYRDSLRLSIAPESVEMVDFNGAVN